MSAIPTNKDEALHEYVQKNRQRETNAARYHTAFDFAVTSNLGRNSSPVVQLLLRLLLSASEMAISANQGLLRSIFSFVSRVSTTWRTA